MRAGIAGVLLVMTVGLLGSGGCLDSDEPGPPQCGCGQTPRCGESCQGPCACCPVFGTWCASEGIRRADPTGQCYDVVPCSGPDRCVNGSQGAVCAESADDCAVVREAYDARLQSEAITTVRSGDSTLAAGRYSGYCPGGCQVSEGHCAEGLATCWFISSPAEDAELDRLAKLYAELGCPKLGACDCPPMPLASCQYDKSQANGSYPGPLTCTVE